MKFAFKFKLPKWERPKPEVPYVSNPIIGELENIDFVALTAERRRDVLIRIKHASEAIAAERRRNPAILTDRIRLQRMWVDYFRINQTMPAGDDVGASLSFSHEDMNANAEKAHRAPGALMTTQEELLAQASFKIDMGDMVMDDMDDFDTPPPRLPPRPMPGTAAGHHEAAGGPVHVVTHPETGDSLHIAGLHDLVIAPPEASVAALSNLASAQTPEKSEENKDTPQASSPASDEEPKLDAQAQAELVARMRALAQSEAAAAGPEQASETLSDNPMIARMRALAAAKAAEAEQSPPTEEKLELVLTLDSAEDPSDPLAEHESDAPLVLDLPQSEPEAVKPEPQAEPRVIQTAPVAEQEPPRLSPEEQIRLAEDMRARIKAENSGDPAPADDPMVERMRKLAKAGPKQAPALTISIPEDPVEAAPSQSSEDNFEAIKNEIVAQTLQEAQNGHSQTLTSPEPEKIDSSASEPVEPGMLDRLRRLAGLGGKKSEVDQEAAPPSPEPLADKKERKKQKPETPAADAAPKVEAEPIVAPAPNPTPAVPPLPLFATPFADEAPPAPEPAAPEPAPQAPRPREREASATPSTRDWVNVKLLRPTVIRGLPLPDQVITIVPYPDAKRLEENGSVQILTKPRAPRN